MTGFPLALIAMGLPSSWVQVKPWQTLPHVIFHLGVLCNPGCSSLPSPMKEDIGLTSDQGITCRGYISQQIMAASRNRCGNAAQVLCAGRILAGCVPCALLLGDPWVLVCTSTHSQEDSPTHQNSKIRI